MSWSSPKERKDIKPALQWGCRTHVYSLWFVLLTETFQCKDWMAANALLNLETMSPKSMEMLHYEFSQKQHNFFKSNAQFYVLFHLSKCSFIPSDTPSKEQQPAWYYNVLMNIWHLTDYVQRNYDHLILFWIPQVGYSLFLVNYIYRFGNLILILFSLGEKNSADDVQAC